MPSFKSIPDVITNDTNAKTVTKINFDIVTIVNATRKQNYKQNMEMNTNKIPGCTVYKYNYKNSRQ